MVVLIVKHAGSHSSGGALGNFVASDLAIAPDGSRAYVLGVQATSGGDVQVIPVDVANGKSATPIDLPMPPRNRGVNGTIVLSPDGRTGYVTYPGDTTVTPVNLASGTVGHTITLTSAQLGGSGAGVCGLAVAPGGQTAYVTGCGALKTGTVVPISLPSGTVGRPIPIDISATRGSLEGIAIAPDAKTAYLTDVQVAASSQGDTVLPVSLSSGAVGQPIHVASGPVYEADLALAPGGGTAYVTSLVDQGHDHMVTVTPVDLTTGHAATAIHIGDGQPVFGDNAYTLAVTPSGTTGYILFVQGSHKTGTIIPLALPTGTEGAPIHIGTDLQGAAIAVAPGGKAAYVTSATTSGAVHTKVTPLPTTSS
ncbi:MAG: YncE family protein [Streptosporangiaceae bacterium]